MRNRETYVGIHNDRNAGLTDAGRIVLDAWVFGIIPETETCEGWSYDAIQSLYDKVTAAWKPYGHLVSNLPEDLRTRHQRIYSETVSRAREQGWNPSLDDEND